MERPWVKPEDVIEYTDNEKIKTRSHAKLESDIARAEKYVIFHTHNHFDDEKKYPELPTDVRLAVILLAESYANTDILTKNGAMKSESFDDYSYTLDDRDEIERLGLGPLLDDYVIEQKGTVTFRMRKL